VFVTDVAVDKLLKNNAVIMLSEVAFGFLRMQLLAEIVTNVQRICFITCFFTSSRFFCDRNT
jgi:hypothetical protein